MNILPVTTGLQKEKGGEDERKRLESVGCCFLFGVVDDQRERR